MSDLDLEKLERHVRGFPGKFQFGAYDDGTEQLEYIGPDGDEDDPYVVGEGVEQHVAEPIADMLNAVRPLIAAIRERDAETGERNQARVDYVAAMSEVAKWRKRAEVMLVATDAGEVDTLRRQRDEALDLLAKMKLAAENYHKQTSVLGEMHNAVVRQRDEALEMLAKMTDERDGFKALLVRRATIMTEVQRSLYNAGVAIDRPLAMRVDLLAAERDLYKPVYEAAKGCRIFPPTDKEWRNLMIAIDAVDAARKAGAK